MPKRDKAHLLIASAVFLTVAGSLHAQQASSGAVPENDISKLKNQLYDVQTKDDLRDQAASRLLARPDPSARAILEAALMAYSQPAVQRSATHALADNPTADTALITPLFALLDPNNDPSLIRDAALGLTAFKDNGDVLNRLLALATNGPDVRIRIAAIRAAGTFVDKRIADALLQLMDPAAQPPEINKAASDAMAYMTGLNFPNGDLAAWRAWWNKYQSKSDADFQADLLQSRAGRFDQTQASINDMQTEMLHLAQERYQKATREDRADLLLRLMRSSEPTVRVIGCQIARDAAESDVTVAQPIKAQLRDLIGDASPAVRRQAAEGLALINDADALIPLLTQLNQEQDSTVRAAIANALRPIRDIRSVQPLMVLLDDPSIATAQAAAGALGERELGTQLRQANPALADQLAAKLHQTTVARTTSQNNIDLRNSLIQAMIPLQSQAQARELTAMLNSPSESPNVRRSLLAAVGEYHDPQFSDAIAAWLDDKFDPKIRLAAVQALGQSANSFGDFEKRLYDRIDKNVEPQPEVRDAAWAVLVKLFATAPKDQLGAWEIRLKNDPAHLLAVLKEERSRSADPLETAQRNQQIGDNSAKIGQWDDAINAYRDALKYAQENKNSALIEILSEGLANAYLGARQYPQAIAFIQEQIRSDPSLQGTLGPVVRIEADRLVHATPYDFEAAKQFINGALNMDPKLKPQFTVGLPDLFAEAQKRSTEQNLSPYNDLNGLQNAMAR